MAARSIFRVVSSIFNFNFFKEFEGVVRFKKIVYPSLIPCSVPGESRYERGRLWTRRPLGFFLNTIARGVVSDPGVTIPPGVFFCFRILSELKQNHF